MWGSNPDSNYSFVVRVFDRQHSCAATGGGMMVKETGERLHYALRLRQFGE